jgi:flagellar basal-body rod protein FlgG
MLALQISASGMQAQERRTETVANNLANMNTTGYQRRRTEFNDLIYKNMRRPANASSRPGDEVPSGVHLGLGVKAAAIYRVTEQGHLKSTGGPLDLAIQGAGYFQVQLPNGETAFTRDGTLQLNPEGIVVNHDGFPLQPNITVPPGTQDITVNSTGSILASIPGQDEPSNVGTVQLVLFPNDGALKAVGNNLYVPTTESGGPTVIAAGEDGAGTILQGYVESSNVNPIEEITNLIRAQRAYDMNSKVMQTADSMMAPGSK